MFGFRRKADAAKTEAAIEGMLDALVLIASRMPERSQIAKELRVLANTRGGVRGSVIREASRRIEVNDPSAEIAMPSTGERLDSLMNRFDN